MNNKEMAAFQDRCRNMPTEDLVSATTVHRDDYQPDALSVMDRELASRDVPVDRQQAVAQEIIQKEVAVDQRHRGIRGWLIVFILVVAIGSLIGLLSGIYRLVSQSQNILWILLVVLGLLIALYGFVAVVLMLRKKPSGPSHAARWLIADVIYYGIMVLITIESLGVRDRFVVASRVLGLMLWLTYLERSRRVAATYGKTSKKMRTSGPMVRANARPSTAALARR